MSYGSDLYTQLSGYTALTSLVGSRIYPRQVKQATGTPYLVLEKVSDIPIYSHQGYSHLRRMRQQVSVYASSDTEAEAVVAQVKAAMEAWPAANSSVQMCLMLDDYGLLDEEAANPDGSGLALYHNPVDFTIHYAD